MPQTRTAPRHAGRIHGEAEALAHQRQRQPLDNAGAFQPVLTIRARVPKDEVPAFTREALQEIRSYIDQHHLQVEGPPFSVHHDATAERVDVEAGWPARGAPGAGRIHSGALPVSRLRGLDIPPHADTD